MKTRENLLCMAVLLAAVTLTSCEKEPVNPQYRAFATVLNPDSVSDYVLLSDQGNRLKPINSPYVPKHRQRLIADFYIASEKPEGSDYDYDIEYTYLYEILTKGIFNVELDAVTPAEEDSIGNDEFIEMGKPWVASDFVNVEFLLRASDRGIKHFINLVAYPDSVPAADGKVHLQLRHNSKGDYPDYDRWGIAAFDLLPLRDKFQEQDSVNIVIHASLYNMKEQTEEVTYRWESAEEAIPVEPAEPKVSITSLKLE